MRGITKRFGELVANRDVSLEVAPGEVRGLVGENGAGKTTLMAIASGLYRPDAGAIAVDGHRHQFRSPLDAIASGIDMVHQHFMLLPTLTVAENVVLGVHGRSQWLRLREARREVLALGERYSLGVNPSALVGSLSPSQQQRVEILTALYRGSRILILDEPTSVLVPHEIENLFKTMRELAAERRSVIFISHKLDEILAVCDRISVMRAGELVATLDRDKADATELARLMVGHAVDAVSRRPRQVAPAPPVLAVEGLGVRDERMHLAVSDVHLSVAGGEILTLAGVEGNGQRELIEAIVGLRRPVEGRIFVHERDVTNAGLSTRIELGMAYVPEDPRRNALLLPFPLSWNTGLRYYRRTRRRWMVDFRQLEALTEKAIHEFDIRGAAPATLAGNLSGGNQQKAVLARELGLQPNLLVVVNPTAGLDVGAAAYVHGALRAARDRGVAILLASTDLDEVEALSDRIAVMYRGRVASVLTAEEADRPRLGVLMAGVRASGADLPSRAS